MWRLFITFLLIAVFCLGAAVSYFNWSSVTFNYLAGETQLPLIALLLAAFIVGVFVIGLLNLARMFVLRRDNRRLQRQVRELEAELRSLRSLPLAGTTPNTPAGTPTKNA